MSVASASSIVWIGTETPPGHWNTIARRVADDRGTDLVENARLFALLNIAMADAAICAWDAKYTYDFWRPFTAIRSGDADGNPATIADPSWSSFIVTPPFPDYVSGHSTFSGAAATVLAKYNVAIRSEPLVRLRPVNGCLSAVELENIPPVPLDALFFNLGSPAATDIANQLGCEREKGDDLQIDRAHQTTVPGIFAAGDIVGPPYLAVSAAAKGVTAAMGVHRSLLPPDSVELLYRSLADLEQNSIDNVAETVEVIVVVDSLNRGGDRPFDFGRLRDKPLVWLPALSGRRHEGLEGWRRNASCSRR